MVIIITRDNEVERAIRRQTTTLLLVKVKKLGGSQLMMV